MTNPDRLRAMEKAVLENNVKKVRLFLKAGVQPLSGVSDDPERSFVSMSARHGRLEVFEVLWAACGETLHHDILIHAVGSQNSLAAIVRRILESMDIPPSTLGEALVSASAQGHLNIVSLLLESGADPNTCSQAGRYPLINAIENGYSDVARQLLDNGAKPSVAVPVNENEPCSGSSCKELAKKCGLHELVPLLDGNG